MHRTFSRALAVVAGLAAPLAFATPVLADPTDGEGCIGLQGQPAAYVCVISVDPSATPGVTPTGSATVFSERVCYLAGCNDVTVTVPTYGVDMPDGPLLVLYYNGNTYSIGLTALPSPPPTGGYVTTVATLAGTVLGTAVGTAGGAADYRQNVDVIVWADCTLESETDDRVDISSSSSFSGYTAYECTDRYLLP